MNISDPLSFLADGLKDITRKERRNLLLTVTIGLAVAMMDLVPSQLSALGVTLTIGHQANFKILMGVVILYFVVAFTIYGVADFMVWYDNRQKNRVLMMLEKEERWEEWRRQREYRDKHPSNADPEAESDDEQALRIEITVGRRVTPEDASAVATLRMVFDVAFPILLGLGVGGYLALGEAIERYLLT